jgi:hypothetical protein
VTVNVAVWTDDRIEVTGYGNYYGATGNGQSWKFHAGDRVEIRVWNPQTKTGPAAFSFTMARDG